MRKVPFFNYQHMYQSMGKQILEVVEDVVSRGAYIMQQDLRDFEKDFAEYLGVKHAIGVANCTDGLILALRAAGIQPGDEVLVPTHTFIATAASVHLTGGVPVPVECGEDHLMDVNDLEHRINEKTKFIMPVQLNGRVCNMDVINGLAVKYNLQIVEDAAQSLGASFKGQKAGSFGVAAAFSFYPAKVLGCLGDGGMVVTNDDEVAKKLMMMRDHGRGESGDVELWAGNSRLDNLQAAILHFQFKEYDETIVNKRRHLAALYNEHLKDVKEVLLPPAPDSDPDHFDVFQNYEVEFDCRDEIQEFLKENGVGTLRQWSGKTVHQFEKLGFNVSLPRAEKMISRSFMVPLNMSLTDEDVKYVCDLIKSFYASKGATSENKNSVSA